MRRATVFDPLRPHRGRAAHVPNMPGRPNEADRPLPGPDRCHAPAVTTGSARARLDAAVRERDRARTELDAADAVLRNAIREAAATGVSQVELAELTGFHRNTVRRIVTED